MPPVYHPHPIIFKIGPLALRWYSLAYICGLLFGWLYVNHLVKYSPKALTKAQVGDLLLWVAAGVIFGGRLGFVLFYQFDFYSHHPIEIVKIWQGGMSSHGGFIGVVIALILFTRRYRLRLLAVGDVVSCAVPLGLMLGRLANFANGELYGRVAGSNAPFAIIFPEGGGMLPRHPSQLYEASLEGLLLFIIMWLLWRLPAIRNREGLLTGLFLTLYAVARIIAELYREPDYYLGYYFETLTMGQILSLPMLLIGLIFIIYRWKCSPKQT